MSGSNQNNSQIHSEIENVEDLRFGECQNYNSTEFGQCNSRKYLKIEKKNDTWLNNFRTFFCHFWLENSNEMIWIFAPFFTNFLAQKFQLYRRTYLSFFSISWSSSKPHYWEFLHMLQDVVFFFLLTNKKVIMGKKKVKRH